MAASISLRPFWLRALKLAAVILAGLLLLPYLLAPLYLFGKPVSTLMLARWAAGARVERPWVPLEAMAESLPVLVIVAEDARFCRHPGIDLVEIRDAIGDADSLSDLRGASTLSQQTAKNLFLWPGRSFLRKFLETPLALWLDLVLGKRAENAFCAVRPPGHHATRTRAMGFCLFNNVAVAAKHALEQHGLERVAIIDFDVHHGNGTEDIFSDDQRVVMASIFQHPFYPYSGTEDPAPNMANVPLPAGSDGRALRAAVDRIWMPALEELEPQMIFISAGFDAHVEDDMAMLRFTESDYAWVTQRVKEIADKYAEGRIVSVLEGGYALSALGRSVVAHLKVLGTL